MGPPLGLPACLPACTSQPTHRACLPACVVSSATRDRHPAAPEPVDHEQDHGRLQRRIPGTRLRHRHDRQVPPPPPHCSRRREDLLLLTQPATCMAGRRPLSWLPDFLFDVWWCVQRAVSAGGRGGGHVRAVLRGRQRDHGRPATGAAALQRQEASSRQTELPYTCARFSFLA